MLIDYTYFMEQPTKVAGIDVCSGGTPSEHAQALRAHVESYIRRYEPRFLRDLIGYAAELPQEALPLLANPNTRHSVIASYVYFHYERDNMARNTIAGEKRTIGESSTNASPEMRLLRLWNDMSDECRRIVDMLDEDGVCISPNVESGIFYHLNAFGL